MTSVSDIPAPSLLPHELRIGDWILDPERNELRRNGESIRLEPKAIEVLVQLARRPGRAFKREELLSLVWPGVVVGDDALTQAIIKLRKALGDEAHSPTYIETIPKRGYRLVAPVVSPDAPPRPPESQPRWRRPGTLVAILALATFALAGIVATFEVIKGSGKPWPLAAEEGARQPAGAYPIVAVLPLSNLSGEPGRDYLSDGLTEDITNALGRFSGLRVMSRNAVQVYRGMSPPLEAIKRDLGARYIVQGSVRKEGPKLRVAIALSDAEKGVQLWSERHDAEGAQLFEVQDRIVRNVVGTLAVKLTDVEQQRAFSRPTENAEAYDLAMRARALIQMDDRAANREARSLLARASRLAPEYAEVPLLLGEAEWRRAAYGWVEDTAGSVLRAEEYARRVLASPDSQAHPRAHSLLATLLTHQGRPEEALVHTGRAIAMNPSDAGSLFRHGHALLGLGKADEAVAILETGMRFDPRASPGPHTQLVSAYYAAGRYRDAVAYADAVLPLSPWHAGLQAIRAAALAQLGELEEARRAAETVRRLDPRFLTEEAGTRMRDPEQARKLREGLTKAGL